MKKKSDPFTGLFKEIEDQNAPTKAQEDNMLYAVLAKSRMPGATPIQKTAAWIAEYPWRFAFGTAALQTAVCALVFGAGYTRFIMGFFGG